MFTSHCACSGGGRVVVVDALDLTTRSFYEHHDFTPLPGQPHQFVMKLSRRVPGR